MKTQIIQLEPHDDIVSARDKINACQAGRILLIWPPRGRLLGQRLDLVLIQRQAAQVGAQIALITPDREVRYQARRLGLPVFPSLRNAQRSVWRTPRRKRLPKNWRTLQPPETRIQRAKGGRTPLRPLPPSQPLPALARLGIFTLGVLAVVSIAAILTPRAEISLSPRMKTQSVDIQVQADPQAKSVLVSGIVPVQVITVTVEGRAARPTSGSLTLPDRYAVGQAVFTNLTDQMVSIPEGTPVRTAGSPVQRYRTGRGGEVAAGPGQTLTLPVRAVTPGRDGNLPAGRLRAVEGVLSTELSVENPQPISGGADGPVRAPGPGDREALRQELEAALRQSAAQELEKKLAEGDLLLNGTLVLNQALEESFSPQDAHPASQISLNQQLEFSAQVLAGEDLRSLALSVLDAGLPPGYEPLPDTLELQSDPAQPGSDLLAWRLSAQRRIRASIPAQQAVRRVLGLPPAAASQRLLAALPLDAPPDIRISPNWWPRLPFLPLRFQVSLEQTQE